MLTNRTTIYISGANGNLGAEIMNRLISRTETRVVKLKRDSNNSYLKNLSDSKRINQSSGEMLIHCGWDVVNRHIDNQRICFAETESLSEFCSINGIKMVFISSTSASVEARSNYGIMKYRAERAVVNRGGLVLRPGLVLFQSPKGIQRQINSLNQLRISFKITPDIQISVIDIDHLLDEVESLVKESRKLGVFDCLGNKTTSLNALTGAANVKSKVVITIPLSLMMLLLRFCGRMNTRIRNMHDSMKGVTWVA